MRFQEAIVAGQASEKSLPSNQRSKRQDEPVGTTGTDLIEYLDHLIRVRGLNPTYKTACTKVLRAGLGEHWTTADLALVEIDSVLQAADARQPPEVAPTSWNTYKSRCRSTVTRFLGDLPWPAVVDDSAPDVEDTVTNVLDTVREVIGDRPLTRVQADRLRVLITEAVTEARFSTS